MPVGWLPGSMLRRPRTTPQGVVRLLCVIPDPPLARARPLSQRDISAHEMASDVPTPGGYRRRTAKGEPMRGREIATRFRVSALAPPPRHTFATDERRPSATPDVH